jgi:hypothetical protein
MNAWKFHDPEEIYSMEFPWNKWNKVSVDQKWNMCGRDYWCKTNDEPIKTSNNQLL